MVLVSHVHVVSLILKRVIVSLILKRVDPFKSRTSRIILACCEIIIIHVSLLVVGFMHCAQTFLYSCFLYPVFDSGYMLLILELVLVQEGLEISTDQSGIVVLLESSSMRHEENTSQQKSQ